MKNIERTRKHVRRIRILRPHEAWSWISGPKEVTANVACAIFRLWPEETEDDSRLPCLRLIDAVLDSSWLDDQQCVCFPLFLMNGRMKVVYSLPEPFGVTLYGL